MDAPLPPQARQLLVGPAALSDEEVVALVIGGPRAMLRARALLDSLEGIAGLAKVEAGDSSICVVAGPAGAAALVAAMELGRRLARTVLPWATPLCSPREAAVFVQSKLRGAKQEQFLVLGLDSRQRIRMVRTTAIGGLAQVEVHPREVFAPLLRARMHACIVAHNHPSGDVAPSHADIELTHRLVEVGRLVGISVLDHLVVTDSGFSSLAELGLL